MDPQALAASLQALVARHEALRTTFELRGRAVMQLIQAEAPVELACHDLTRAPLASRAEAAREACATHAAVPLDARRAPLLAASLFRLADDDHVLLLRAHQLVVDGASMAILVEDLAALYVLRLGGDAEAPADPGAQLADYTEWQRTWMDGESCQQQLAFWVDELRDRRATMSIFGARSWPRRLSPSGGRVTHDLPSDLPAALDALARERDSTLQMVFIAALLMLLARYTDEPEVHVTVPVAARFRPNLDRTVGLIANRIPICADVHPATTFLDVLAQVRARLLDALDNHDVPFESVIAVVRPERHAATAPFGQILLQHVRRRPRSGAASAWSPFPFDVRHAPSHLHFRIVEDTSITIQLRYCSDLCERATAQRMADDYAFVLSACKGNVILRDLSQIRSPSAGHAPTSSSTARRSGARVGPRTPTEATLLDMWRALLGRDIGTTDDFFDSGGDSLAGLRLLLDVEQTFGVRLPLVRVFELPTVQTMAAAIEKLR
jgi:acyl carrier protein